MDNKAKALVQYRLTKKLLSLRGNCTSSLFWLTSSTKAKQRNPCGENKIAYLYVSFAFVIIVNSQLQCIIMSLLFLPFITFSPRVCKYLLGSACNSQVSRSVLGLPCNSQVSRWGKPCNSQVSRWERSSTHTTVGG